MTLKLYQYQTRVVAAKCITFYIQQLVPTCTCRHDMYEVLRYEQAYMYTYKFSTCTVHVHVHVHSV